MHALEGQYALVTGANSGIGRGITLALARKGVHIVLVARDEERLEATAQQAEEQGDVQTLVLPGDLTDEDHIEAIGDHVEQDIEQLDILVHCAGIIRYGTIGEASLEDLDAQYATNFRAPYALTKTLLPHLLAAEGQIVFVNSSAVDHPKAHAIQFTAFQHALRGFAACLREDVNPTIRVLSVFPGRTATPRQERLFKKGDKKYLPEYLVQPEDVAATITRALELPRTAEVTDIWLRPRVATY